MPIDNSDLNELNVKAIHTTSPVSPTPPLVYSMFDISDIMRLSKHERFRTAIGILRRHPLIMEADNKCIGFYYAKDACSEQIINALYIAHLRDGENIPFPDKHTIEMFRDLERLVWTNVVSTVNPSKCNHNVKQEDLPKVLIPKFAALTNYLEKEMQLEWINAKQFEYLTHFTRIVDAIYHDQTIIFIVDNYVSGDVDDVYIGEIINNEFVNIMFMDRDLNILSAKTYCWEV